MKEFLDLGMDIGSVSINTVVLNRRDEVVFEDYRRTHGEPLPTALAILRELQVRFAGAIWRLAAFTGIGGKMLAEALRSPFINEVIAQARGAFFFLPQARTIIDMGGEDAKLILLDQDEQGGLVIQDFAMNTMCAAGTGSFLDQQSHRLGYGIEDFSRLALKSTTPPRIAGRCSVFAKTDMIHLQQGATPDYEIIAGLCLAMARNLKSNIAKGKTIRKPVVFQGGVAHNLGVRQAFRQVFELDEGDLIIPPHFCSLGAVGAVLVGRENPSPDFELNLGELAAYLQRSDRQQRHLTPLSEPEPLTPDHYRVVELPPQTAAEGYLGIDVGSISTNIVVIDAEMQVLAREYLMTAGRPLEAVTEGMRRIGKSLGDRLKILGAATTGSGRYLTADFIGADLVRNEITAQATAAAAINPQVDTIFEIGGQDSKFISLEHGAIVDFMMNKVCAAGTGSFLEEQAEKLGIAIKEEFGRLALASTKPVPLGERCTVFMESDLVHHQQQGAAKEDLVAGLAYSIVQNYLNKVKEERRVGNVIFYQGATAANRGIVAAFEAVLGKKIIVPPHHDVTGAIGAAILAKRERTWETSRFKGFDLVNREYSISSFECQGCPNTCEIRQVKIVGEKPLFYGGRCEKYEVSRAQQTYDLPDLFRERDDWLYGEEPPQAGRRGLIGLPRAMFFQELMPFFRTFFESLGFGVMYSPKTNKAVIRRGVECMAAETCFPVKVAHGHILDLLESGIDQIFLPSIIDLQHPNPTVAQGLVCPLAQTLAYTVPATINFSAYQARLLAPVIYFGRGPQALRHSLRSLGRQLGVSSHSVDRAWRAAEAAQMAFYQRLQARGREILATLSPENRAMVIVSRPYNGFDCGVNLNLPRKLRQLGVLAIPMDFLPLDESGHPEEIKEMYWRFGQKILAAADIIRKDPQLYAVYVTNFSCGPDSFIQHFFKDKMQGKPYLEIEIDEHSADVGAITRLEAFLDSLKNVSPLPRELPMGPPSIRIPSVTKRKVYVPPMTDHALALVAAFEACGMEAELLPPSDEETLLCGRRLTSGKECYPLILTTGDMAKMTRRADFDPDRSAFFMPGGDGPCRFGQYNRLQRMILNDLGFPQTPIVSPNQTETFYQELGMVGDDFSRIAWQGVVAIDLLEKKVREIRPYERYAGEADAVYAQSLQKVYQTLRHRGDLPAILGQIKQAFHNISRNGLRSKPVVGVVGEIYTRANTFANEDTVREIEALGGEVWMAPISEWLLYVNFTAKRRAWQTRQWKHFLQVYLTERVQQKDEHRLAEVFRGSLKNLSEPPIADLIANAKDYLDSSFEGEGILSIGKSKDFIRQGVSGLVNIMPFTCMPGTVVNALFKRFREEHDNIPFLNLAYDGQEQTNTRTRMEAFMYQVRQYQELHH